MIIPSVKSLKSNFPANFLKYQHQPDRPHRSKKHHGTSSFWRYSAFLVAGLTSLVIGSAATPVVAQPRIIEQLLDMNNRQNVTAIQDALRSLGYTITVDGSFGQETRTVLLNFQRDNNLPVTGVVDNITANRLFARVQESSPSDRQSIRAIQDRLNRLGYDIRIDGVLGPQTQRAITNFQQANHLSATGVLDRSTSDVILGRTSSSSSFPPDGTRERFCRDQNNLNQICFFVVLIPGDNNRLIDIRRRLLVNYPLLAENMVLEDHGRGLFIRIRQYRDRGEAENVANILRNNISPDFRVEFLPSVTPISTRG